MLTLTHNPSHVRGKNEVFSLSLDAILGLEVAKEMAKVDMKQMTVLSQLPKHNEIPTAVQIVGEVT